LSVHVNIIFSVNHRTFERDMSDCEEAVGDPGARRLVNPRYEAFAWALACGASRTDAYERAGYRRNRFSASALARRPEVAARIAWLEARERAIAQAAPEPTLVALLSLVDAGRRATSAACARETRLTLLAARDLHRALEPEEAPVAASVLYPQLTGEEWNAKYGPGGTYWGGGDPP
jgi:hypothetical protein